MKTSSITKSYIIAKYLSDLCQSIGQTEYLNSVIRRRHFNGQEVFGIPNNGSSDCLAQLFRQITDNLGLTFKSCDQIKFVSNSCIGLTNDQRNKDMHRIEHTTELHDIYDDFEKEYILTGIPFTPAIVGKYVIENQIVTLIRKKEQKKKNTYDLNIPFSKYTNSIFHNGVDVSNYTLLEVRQLVIADYGHLLNQLENIDFTSEIDDCTQALFQPDSHHSLPPLDLAELYYNDKYELFKQWYTYHASRVLNPNDSRSKPEHAKRLQIFFETGVKL